MVHCVVKHQNARRAFAQAGFAREHADMNLKAIRNARGLTQAQLAEIVGVDQSTITRAETMHHSAKLETCQRCADALGVTLADLFGDVRTSVEAALVEAYRRAGPAERALLEGYLLAAQEAAKAKE